MNENIYRHTVDSITATDSLKKKLLQSSDSSADVEIPVNDKKSVSHIRRWIAVATMFILILGIAIWGRTKLTPPQKTVIPASEAEYISLADIPITIIGNISSEIEFEVPGLLFSIDGDLFFSYGTRYEELNTGETKGKVKLFKINSEDNSYCAVSDDVGGFRNINGLLMYTRTDECVNKFTMWDFDYYTNNVEWNDEKKISTQEAKELVRMKEPYIYSTVMDGTEVNYTVEYVNDPVYGAIIIGINIKFDDGRVYNIEPDFSSDIESAYPPNIHNFIGILGGKVYFSVNYALVSDSTSYRWDLFSINLDGSDLNMITQNHILNKDVEGEHMGNDGNIYYQISGTTSRIMKLDCRTNTISELATIDGYLRDWVKNDDAILCKLSHDEFEFETRLFIIKLN